MDNTYISIIDYAKSKNVSTQAVYKQIKTHQKELEGLIITESGKRWLSPDAVKILDDASKASPIVYVEDADKAKLEAAELRIKELEEHLKIAQDKYSQAQDTVISLLTEKVENTVIIERSKMLLEQKDLEVQNLKTRSLWKRIFNN